MCGTSALTLAVSETRTSQSIGASYLCDVFDFGPYTYYPWVGSRSGYEWLPGMNALNLTNDTDHIFITDGYSRGASYLCDDFVFRVYDVRFATVGASISYGVHGGTYAGNMTEIAAAYFWYIGASLYIKLIYGLKMRGRN